MGLSSKLPVQSNAACYERKNIFARLPSGFRYNFRPLRQRGEVNTPHF